ncbi:MAG: 4-hydroxybenzoate octaprenyltransferase [Gammaproteobacteria bacterium]
MTRTLLDYWHLIRGHRPIGFWLLLWPVLWALWIAGEGHPGAEVFCVFVAGTWLMRSAGCAINDYADRDFDPHVQRTRDRPLAAGRISPLEALLVFAALSLVALALVLRLNPLVQLYAVGGAVLAVVYPFLKRWVSVPQFWMGAAFSWGMPMAFAAETGEVPRVAWLLFCGGLLWAAAYDTMYGMVDRDDDLRIGVKSTAILFGDADRLIIGLMQALTLVAWWLAGREAGLASPWWFGGLTAAALTFVHQQRLIRQREREGCFAAFLNNAWTGAFVFGGLLLHYTFQAG